MQDFCLTLAVFCYFQKLHNQPIYVDQCGPTCGPRKEFLRPASFLSIVCCMNVTISNLSYKHNIFLIKMYNISGVKLLDCRAAIPKVDSAEP